MNILEKWKRKREESRRRRRAERFGKWRLQLNVELRERGIEPSSVSAELWKEIDTWQMFCDNYTVEEAAFLIHSLLACGIIEETGEGAVNG